jgi:hypothetical protein
MVAEEPVINRQTRNPKTWGEEVESLKESMLYHMASPRKWPDREILAEDQTHELLDRMLTEVKGVDTMPDPVFAFNSDYENELNVGDSPLTIAEGWQEASDNREAGRSQSGPNLPPIPTLTGVGKNNELLNSTGEPIIATENSSIQAFLVTPEGQKVPLNRGLNGDLVLPTPNQITEPNDAMDGMHEE